MGILGNGTAFSNLWPESRCRTVITFNVASIAFCMLFVFFMVFLCNGVHALLRPFSQPRIISESAVGLFIGNLPLIQITIQSAQLNKTLSYIADVGMIFHMFVLGLDIDPCILLQPSREVKVACAGMLSTFVLAIFVTPLLHIPNVPSIIFNLSLSVALFGTASPLLTRLITDLKIGKSDIGRFVVSAGIQSDLVSTLLLSLGFIIFDPVHGYRTRTVPVMLHMFLALVLEAVVAAKVSPLFLNWVNNENPEGKPMKGSHLILSTAYVVFVCGCSPIVAQFNSRLSAFVAGIFIPREGRISKMMISKVNYFLTTIFYPLFFFWVGAEGELAQFEGKQPGTWARLFFLFLTATVGKVFGTVVSMVMLGFHWPESVAIGLLLNIKGHFHVYLAIIAAKVSLSVFFSSSSF